MKIVVGLGNPWEKYAGTRHNIGFSFLDWYIGRETLGTGEKNTKFHANITETVLGWEKTLLVQPLTFMNLSGECVLKLLSFYKIEKKDIIVIYDDISMEFGKIRFREKGSAGGQNGVKNIIAHIGDEFKRIKIGVGYDAKFDVTSWVLSRFSPEETGVLEKEIFPKVEALVLEHL